MRAGCLLALICAHVQVLHRPCSLHNEDRVVQPHSKLSYESWEDMCDWSLSGGDLGPNGSCPVCVHSAKGGLPDRPEWLAMAVPRLS